MGAGENYRVGATYRWLGGRKGENAELYLTVCGIERCLPDKFYGPAVRDDFHVHFVLAGKGALKIDGKTFYLRRGQIFIIPPGVETYYYADSKDPWHYTWISFAGTRAAYYLEKAGLTRESPVRNTNVEPEEFLMYTEKILNHHELTIENELIRTSLLYEMLAFLIRTEDQSVKKEKRTHYDYSAEDYVDYALEYIHYHYQTVQVNEVASYIGITRSYLAHIFKQKLGISPQEYLLRYKLEQGSRLLRTTSLPVQQIAEKVGYADPLTFSKIFKNYYGLSPKYYRESIKENQETIPEQSGHS